MSASTAEGFGEQRLDEGVWWQVIERRRVVSFQVREAYRKGCDQQPVAGIQRKQSSYRKSVRVSSVEEEVDAAGNMRIRILFWQCVCLCFVQDRWA